MCHTLRDTAHTQTVGRVYEFRKRYPQNCFCRDLYSFALFLGITEATKEGPFHSIPFFLGMAFWAFLAWKVITKMNRWALGMGLFG